MDTSGPVAEPEPSVAATTPGDADTHAELIALKDRAAVFVDGRYTLQVREQVSAMNIGTRYEEITQGFDSIRDDAKAHHSPPQRGAIVTSRSR